MSSDGSQLIPYQFKPGNTLWKQGSAKRRKRYDSLMYRAVTAEDWKAAIAALVAKAREGDVRAIEILLDRILGKAVAHVELTGNVQPNQVLIAIQEGIARQFGADDNGHAEGNGNGNGRSHLPATDQPLPG